jgi:peptide-methionine (S)-S-oxide reductase
MAAKPLISLTPVIARSVATWQSSNPPQSKFWIAAPAFAGAKAFERPLMKNLLSAVLLLVAMPAVAHAETKTAPATEGSKTAIFAGGCFWCMESEYEDLKGVSDVVSGYAGPKRDTPPTYEEVGTGQSGYVEAVSVTYDPAVVTYAQLLDIFWSNVDPFDDKGQFCDKGSQYVAAIFAGSPEEEKLAQDSLKKVEEKFGQTVATQIHPAEAFYPAEDYHQDYYKTNSLRYKLYRNGCGRDGRLEDIQKSAE